MYPDRVQALGKGLAMDEERLKVSAENSCPGRGLGEEGGGGRGLSACQTYDIGCKTLQATISGKLSLSVVS